MFWKVFKWLFFNVLSCKISSEYLFSFRETLAFWHPLIISCMMDTQNSCPMQLLVSPAQPLLAFRPCRVLKTGLKCKFWHPHMFQSPPQQKKRKKHKNIPIESATWRLGDVLSFPVIDIFRWFWFFICLFYFVRQTWHSACATSKGKSGQSCAWHISTSSFSTWEKKWHQGRPIPASSRWPFDFLNGGHLSPEKVTYGSKWSHFEEPVWFNNRFTIHLF